MTDRPDRSVFIAQVDSFTTRRFSGNPAAVCLLPEAREEGWLQGVAAEMNLSETAFPVPSGAPGEYALRWFTPATEVDLCGHATLASAHALWEARRVDAARPIRFRTRSGVLTCKRVEDELGGMIWMDFPAEPPALVDPDDPAEAGLATTLRAALGAQPVRLGRNRFDLVVQLASEDAVRGLRPDLVQLASVEARGVIVTAAGASGAEHDFVSRFFGPRVGVPEDPVTGSAHCGLAPWWGELLGRDRLVGFQVSPRGGTVHCVREGDRVRLGGRAVTVFTGQLFVEAE